MSENGEINLKAKVRALPNKSGVYIMKDAFGQVIYIGKAISLKRRVSQYFVHAKRYNAKIASMVKLIADFDYIITKSDAEAFILEDKLIKQWKPRYNTIQKDDKRFLLLRITTFEPLPRFTFARQRKEDRSVYFGPYLSGSYVRATLAELKKRFGILLSDAHPKRLEDGRWRLYDDARSEIYSHPNETTQEQYRARVDAALEFLGGRNAEILEQTERKMAAASAAMEYEKAAKFRDLAYAMRETLSMNKTRDVCADITKTPKQRAEEACSRLAEVLKLPSPPRSIECFDISHISGSFCVASMVRFEDGESAKRKYRRFKIKSFVGNNDFKAMNEVVLRRYTRLAREGVEMPDIVLIDGGAQQVRFALDAFAGAGITPKRVVGLAKKEETIILEDATPILLPRTDEGLKLFQRVRDEAHRFANSFSEDLRSKKIRESILDDFPKLGEKRKEAILKYFGGIARVKAATAAELAQVDGIGPQTASALRDFLDKNFGPLAEQGRPLEGVDKVHSDDRASAADLQISCGAGKAAPGGGEPLGESNSAYQDSGCHKSLNDFAAEIHALSDDVQKDESYRGRIAPTTSGFLHIGHARTFGIAARRAKLAGGTLVLRIEDLDIPRCPKIYEDTAIKDLKDIGLSWDEGPDVGGDFGPYRQSERSGFYLDAIEKLKAQNLIYPCDVSRSRLRTEGIMPTVKFPVPGLENCIEPERVFPVSLRDNADYCSAAFDKSRKWRFKVPYGETISFTDGHYGQINLVAGRDFGDFLVWRKEGCASYELAVVVDDAAMKITEVVRGADLLVSTARQILLYRALSLPIPKFFHCPLLTDSHGEKISKTTLLAKHHSPLLIGRH